MDKIHRPFLPGNLAFDPGKRNKIVLYILSVVIMIMLACNIPLQGVPLGGPPLVDTATATVQATPTETPSVSPTPGPTETPSFSCPNAPETQLKVGDMGVVSTNEQPSVRFRKEPVVDAKNILKLIKDGAEFEVIGGPECAPIPDSQASFVFWQIRLADDASEGWVAEGTLENYFIEPLP